MDNTNYIAYLLLKEQYMKMNNIDNLSTDDLFLVLFKYFPEDWELGFEINEKIKMLSKALKERINLIELVEEEKSNLINKWLNI